MISAGLVSPDAAAPATWLDKIFWGAWAENGSAPLLNEYENYAQNTSFEELFEKSWYEWSDTCKTAFCFWTFGITEQYVNYMRNWHRIVYVPEEYDFKFDFSGIWYRKDTLPQGISNEQFGAASKLLKQNNSFGGEIVVQGSRANGTAKPQSDIDIAIRVSSNKFDELIEMYFKTPNPGSAKEKTMLHAIKTGKIQSGEAGLRPLRKELEEIFGIEVDISIIKIGGEFDNPPFIPFE